jgi:hypothetical protein
MKVGDLVKYVSLSSGYQEWKEIGIILREIPGTDQNKVVQWNTGVRSGYPARNLVVISESR